MSQPVEDPLNLVGTTLAEKYEIQEVVGEGGFAIVYRAIQTVWKRNVAVKVFRALGDIPDAHRPHLEEEFLREGALLAELSEKSSAIVQARDVGFLKTSGGTSLPYMVLEWLDGKTLETLLADERTAARPPRSMQEAFRILSPVAQALGVAHERGIAHRDVKPANVFVLGDPYAADAQVKLLDFGIAKVVQDAEKQMGSFQKTRGQFTSFTPQYGAPEQFDRSRGATGPWTDVFALALVFVEVLSGREALLGDNLQQLAFASFNTEKRPTPRTFGLDVTDEVEAIFERAVSIDPMQRQSTATQFWTELAAALDIARGSQLPGSARSVSPQVPRAKTEPMISVAGVPAVPATTLREGGKSKTPLILGGIVLVALIGGGVALSRKGEEKKAQPATDTSSIASTAPSAAVVPAATCPEGMVLVSGGQYFMGSDSKLAQKNELPPHSVIVGDYCLDRTEVTVAAYRKCSATGKCLRAGIENLWPEKITEQQRKVYDPLCNELSANEKLEHPINCVDWTQAGAYCSWRDARLPTEAEWEYGARSSDGRTYPWGDAAPSAIHLNACGKECETWGKAKDPTGYWVAMYKEDDGFANTAPVGSFPKGRTGHGIDDMVGNVWEWVSDWYGPYSAGAGAPAENPAGPDKGDERVIRGGAWNGSQPSWVRPSFRYSDKPTKRSYGIGFRCASSVKTSK